MSHSLAARVVSRVSVACFALLIASSARAQAPAAPAGGGTFRPPAVPLVTVDPYTSCWSFNDRLYDEFPKHWTGRIHAMAGIVRVDGKPYRFMGAQAVAPDAATQVSLTVDATTTRYAFDAGPVRLDVTFNTPLLMDDLEVMSRPASYITFAARATDGRQHDVRVYFDATGEWVVNTVEQQVKWGRAKVDGLDVMQIGSADQKILGRKGDNVRIDWGHLYVAVPKGEGVRTAIGHTNDLRTAFAKDGALPDRDDADMPRAARDRWPGLAVVLPLADGKPAHLIVAYDDEYSVLYFNQRLRAWWRRSADASAERMLAAAEADYAKLAERCATFDKEMFATAERAGGADYAKLCALTYRQAIAAHKLVAAPDGRPLFFSKENFSNGSIGTVDVTYPSAPLFLVYNPTLLKGMCDPIFEYTESGKWTKPFPAHDVGTYPWANGQTYGEDMPVEEAGNMIILTGAICRVEGKPEYAKTHWASLTKWAAYLKDKGFDPENQLCTDDFAGHLAHNTNLSVKAIVALACYAQMAEAQGLKDVAAEYTKLAKELAAKWQTAAADGDHFRLTFNKPGTWSQKYNLVWDRALGLNVFSPEIAENEIAFYLKKQNAFGLPLDSRKTYTKSDWIVWSATMAKKPEDFRALTDPIWRYVNETPSRVPVSDWHETTNGKQVGFQARSVVGGYWMKVLADKLAARPTP